MLGLALDDPARLLSGRALADEGIIGAVEADFFDWPLRRPAGAELVRQVAEQTARFRLTEVETDVLKVLYESLVDPTSGTISANTTRRTGWPAASSRRRWTQPLAQRVLDPACGSGTFLFHALRRLIAAGADAGWAERRIVRPVRRRCAAWTCIPSRSRWRASTWLLALGRLLRRPAVELTVPVFLGDAMQWNLSRIADRADVAIAVPGETRPLRIPLGFAEQQAAFEHGLDELNRGLAEEERGGGGGAGVAADRGRVGRGRRRAGADLHPPAEPLPRRAQRHLDLRVPQPGAPGVAVAADQLADVLVGNPPWIVYRH